MGFATTLCPPLQNVLLPPERQQFLSLTATVVLGPTGTLAGPERPLNCQYMFVAKDVLVDPLGLLV
jgi:hypothetical protein